MRLPKVLSVPVALALALSCPAVAGGLTGAATEWTQLANNAQLGQIATLETRGLATETRSLAAQLDQLRTEIDAYEIMRRNVARLPRTHVRAATSSVLRLREIGARAGTLARSGAAADRFLRSDLVRDPLFERRGLDRAVSAERYDAWAMRWRSSLEAGLGQAGATLEDVESEARLLDDITRRMGTEEGQMQVLQGSGQLAASMARQLNDLRAISAVQAEQTAVAWSRSLAERDRREAEDRRVADDLDAAVGRLRGMDTGRSMDELFGIGTGN